ncbi:MAG: IPTL-CTERM sorting domain-containing protein, partial [Planctomycetota bacterium]|nr:IPTL-CTERM sorting domain-containing protein [Planctomycetota bacterium]
DRAGTSGAATVIGPFGECDGGTSPIEGIDGIAFDADGVLWGAHSTGTAGTPGLYQIDTTTGAATFVSPIEDAGGVGPSGGIVSLQFACDGTLYGGTGRALDGLDDGGRLITIDPTTGLMTRVAETSVTQHGTPLGGLAFASSCRPPAHPVPALSEWGLLAMAVLLVAMGGVILCRSRGSAAMTQTAHGR